MAPDTASYSARGSGPEAGNIKKAKPSCVQARSLEGGLVHSFLYMISCCFTCFLSTCITFVKTNERPLRCHKPHWWFASHPYYKPVSWAHSGFSPSDVWSEIPKQKLLSFGGGQPSPWWVAWVTEPWGWITLWVSMRDCKASVSSGSAPRKRSVCSASESHSNSMWTVSRNSSAWNNQAQETELLCRPGTEHWGMPGTGLGLNSVHHRRCWPYQGPPQRSSFICRSWKTNWNFFLSNTNGC